MKKILMPAIIVVILTISATNMAFYFINSGRIAQTEMELSNLSVDIHSIQSGVSGIETKLNGVSEDIAGFIARLGQIDSTFVGLEDKISGLDSTSATLQTDIGDIRGNLDGITGDISGIKTELSSVLDEFSILKAQVNGVQTQIADIQTTPQAGIQVVFMLEPSIVKIISRGDAYTSGGTGVIVNSDGYVLTNNHVIDGANSITVTLYDNTLFEAMVVVTNTTRDLAVLKINSTRTDFQAAALGTLSNVKVGEDVYAMGFPLLFDLSGQGTITSGIVSAIRDFDGYTWIQTDAAINHGNSGGALVNMQGEVIGINTLRYFMEEDGSPVDNVGFAIPIDDALQIIQQATGG